MNGVKIETINIKIGEKIIPLGVEAAKELYKLLGELFDVKQITIKEYIDRPYPYVPYIPYRPWPSDYWITWCDSKTNSISFNLTGQNGTT